LVCFTFGTILRDRKLSVALLFGFVRHFSTKFPSSFHAIELELNKPGGYDPMIPQLTIDSHGIQN
jgi:hypothetical protein